MVDTMSCRDWQTAPIVRGHRSKTWRDCLGIQGLVGWLHPRHSRLGLIEAPRRAIPRPRLEPRIRGTRASASLKLRAVGDGDADLPGSIRGTRASASLKRGPRFSELIGVVMASEALAPRPH